MPKLVQTLFENYLASAYPGHAAGQSKLPPDQLNELKNCFFAAMWASLHEIGTLSAKLPEDVACNVLDRMQRECEEHVKEILDRMYKSN